MYVSLSAALFRAEKYRPHSFIMFTADYFNKSLVGREKSGGKGVSAKRIALSLCPEKMFLRISPDHKSPVYAPRGIWHPAADIMLSSCSWVETDQNASFGGERTIHRLSKTVGPTCPVPSAAGWRHAGVGQHHQTRNHMHHRRQFRGNVRSAQLRTRVQVAGAPEHAAQPNH